MTPLSGAAAGFIPFYRRYTKTWLHALATAALTAFGALAIVHRGFVVLAVAAYVLPPIVLYFTRPAPAAGAVGEAVAGGTETDASATNGAATALRSGATWDTESEAHWPVADSPTDAMLFDVTVTDGDAYAVGADGVVVADDGDGWRIVLADGPGATSRTLRGVDATADGGAVWLAGDGGTVARLDGTTGRHVDVSKPGGRTDTWEDVAVGRASDDERVLLINGSGEVLRGRYRDGDLAWDAPVKPGGGSSLSGVALANRSVGYACDTNDGVFETIDGGETFRRIGIDGADGTLTDVATVARGDCHVSDDDGVLHRHDGGTWTPVRLGDEPLEAVAFRDERGVTCGGNVVYERAAGDTDWERVVTSGPGPLVGVSIGPVRAVAVGGDGTIVERAAA